MENIAIVTVAYNRVKSLSRLLNSLLCADIDNAPLIISIDKSNTNEVERYANDFIWPYGEKKVIIITIKFGSSNCKFIKTRCNNYIVL